MILILNRLGIIIIMSIRLQLADTSPAAARYPLPLGEGEGSLSLTLLACAEFCVFSRRDMGSPHPPLRGTLKKSQ